MFRQHPLSLEIKLSTILESRPFFAVALEGPPLIASVHLVDERQVAEHNALADRPVTAPEVLAKRFDVVDAHELVGYSSRNGSSCQS